MGAAKRKRELAGAVKQLQHEGQGCWHLDIVSPLHIPELAAKYLAGGDHAGRLLIFLEGGSARRRIARYALPALRQPVLRHPPPYVDGARHRYA